MTREVTRRLAALTTVVGVLASSGCGGSGEDHRARATPSTASPAASSTTPSPSTSHAKPSHRARTPGVPEPGSMSEPATTSGPLSRRSFPTPRRLGAGWRYAVDPGSAEEGYAGNGTPALARNPDEVVRTAVPLGCDRRTPMPTPSHALEVDYRLNGATVVAVRSRFADPAQARGFFEARRANLTRCVGRTGSPAIGPLVSGLAEPVRDAVVSDRTPRSDPWREVAVLDGATVAFLAVQGRDPLTPDQTRHVVSLLRS